MLTLFNNEFKGSIAILVSTLIYGSLGIIVRQLVMEGFTPLQTAFTRAFFTLVFLLLIFFFQKKPIISRRLSSPLKDKLLIGFKGIAGFAVGAGFFSLAMMNSTYLSVSAMYAIPFVALFGITLNKEKTTNTKTALLAMSLIGAIFLITKELGALSFGTGEIYAIISAAGLGLSMISRKRFTNHFNNKEIALGSTVFGGFVLLTISLIQGWGVSIPQMSNISWIYMIIGGGMLVFTSIFNNYGFRNVSDIKANIILNTELVWGLMIGVFLYHESVIPKEIIGSVLILASSILLIVYNSHLTKRKTTQS